eukprot:11729243-Prorocentrum_lima.AAC.1
MFREKWEVLRPDAPMAWSDKYHKTGDMLDGVYAEIHKVEFQDMIPALKKEGIVATSQGGQ